MFEMTATQQQAANAAMGTGEAYTYLSDTIHFVAVTLAVIWVLLDFFNQLEQIRRHEISIYELLHKLLFDFFIMVLAAALLVI